MEARRFKWAHETYSGTGAEHFIRPRQKSRCGELKAERNHVCACASWRKTPDHERGCTNGSHVASRKHVFVTGHAFTNVSDDVQVNVFITGHAFKNVRDDVQVNVIILRHFVQEGIQQVLLVSEPDTLACRSRPEVH